MEENIKKSIGTRSPTPVKVSSILSPCKLAVVYAELNMTELDNLEVEMTRTWIQNPHLDSDVMLTKKMVGIFKLLRELLELSVLCIFYITKCKF